MNSSRPNLHYIDLDALCTPPHDWIGQVTSLASRAAKAVHLNGESADCREETTGTGMTYEVVTGEIIARHIPWLIDFYRVTLAAFVKTVMSRPIVPSRSERNGLNINVVQGMGGRYEWHVDPSPVAAILFATAHDIGGGGELVLRAGDEFTHIHPRPGLIAVFEGRKIEHAVLPLKANTVRISIPMLYYYENEKQHFPQKLDEYLYGT